MLSANNPGEWVLLPWSIPTLLEFTPFPALFPSVSAFPLSSESVTVSPTRESGPGAPPPERPGRLAVCVRRSSPAQSRAAPPTRPPLSPYRRSALQGPPRFISAAARPGPTCRHAGEPGGCSSAPPPARRARNRRPRSPETPKRFAHLESALPRCHLNNVG